MATVHRDEGPFEVVMVLRPDADGLSELRCTVPDIGTAMRAKQMFFEGRYAPAREDRLFFPKERAVSVRIRAIEPASEAE